MTAYTTANFIANGWGMFKVMDVQLNKKYQLCDHSLASSNICSKNDEGIKNKHLIIGDT